MSRKLFNLIAIFLIFSLAFPSSVFAAPNDPTTITGKVTGNDGMTAIPGATVSFTGSNPVLSGDDGMFTIDTVAGASGELTAAKEEYDFSPISIDSVPEGGLSGQNLTGTRKIFSISGIVLMDNGEPLGDTVVKLGDSSAESNWDDGSYTITDIPYGTSGSLTPKFDCLKFDPTSIQIDPLTASLSGQNFTASHATYSISGKVTDSLNNPIPGVLVQLPTSGPTFSDTTGDDGTYILTGLGCNSIGDLTGSKNDYVFTKIHIDWISEDMVNQDLTGEFLTKHTITGSVQLAADPSPNPYPTVLVYISTDPDGYEALDATLVDTGGDGTYSFEAYPGDYYIFPLLEQYTFQPPSIHVVLENKDMTGPVEPFIATFNPTFVISGKVSTGAGPLAGAVVSFAGFSSDPTGSDGGYIIFGVPMGTTGSITAAKPNTNYVFSSISVAEPGITSDLIDQDLVGGTGWASIAGTVKTAGGTAIPGAIVSFNGLTAVSAEGTGAYKIQNVPGGLKGVLTATLEGYVFSKTTISSGVSGNLTGKNLTGTPAFQISGTVTDATGPISDVEISFGTSGTFTTTTDAEGKYTIKSIPAGSSGDLTAAADTYVFPKTTITSLQSDLTQDIFGTHVFTITGTVMGSSESNPYIDGAVVKFTDQDGNTYTDTSGSGENTPGTYGIENVPEGATGTLAAFRNGFVFEPILIHTPLSYDQNNSFVLSGQDFTGIDAYTISGTVKSIVSTALVIPGVSIQFVDPDPVMGGTYPAVFAADKMTYALNVPKGATGTYTVTKDGYTFAPASYTLNTALTSNLTGKNFVGTPLFSIRGTVLDRHGTPIPGATVSFGAYAAGTSDSGAYTIEQVPYNTKGEITAAKEGYTFTKIKIGTATVGITSDLTGKDLTGTQLFTISGTILDNAETAQPISGVQVSFTYLPGGSLPAVTLSDDTDGSGMYAISNVPDGTAGTLKAVKVGYKFHDATVDEITGDLSQDFTGEIIYTISGTVKTPAGAAIPGVTVTFGDRSTTTSTTGAYSLSEVPAGASGDLTPTRTGYIFSPAAFSVDSLGSNLTQDFTGSLIYKISGTVTFNGKGLDGVTVLYGKDSQDNDLSVTTANGGKYQINNLMARTYTLTPGLENYAFSPTAAAVAITTADKVQNFTASVDGVAVSGTVKVGNAPISGVGITAKFDPLSEGGDPAFVDLSTTTNAAGAFSLVVPKGMSFTLRAADSYYQFEDQTIAALDAPKTDANWKSATVVVTGKVSAGTNGLEGVTIGANGITTSTDTDGRYTLMLSSQESDTTNKLASLTISAIKTGYTLTPATKLIVRMPGKVTTGEINFSAAINQYSISGTVKTASGAPVAGVTVSAGKLTATTNTAGAYTIASVPYGTEVTLVPWKYGYTFNTLDTFTIDTSNVTNKNFTASQPVPTARSITGKVTLGSASGAPLRDVVVTLTYDDGLGKKIFTSKTTAAGTYSFANLLPNQTDQDKYTLSVSKGVNYVFSPSGAQTIDLADANATQDFVATHVAPVKGRITGLANTTVTFVASVWSDAEGTYKTLTFENIPVDASGNYTLANIPSGVYLLTPVAAGKSFTPAHVSATVTDTTTSIILNFTAR